MKISCFPLLALVLAFLALGLSSCTTVLDAYEGLVEKGISGKVTGGKSDEYDVGVSACVHAGIDLDALK